MIGPNLENGDVIVHVEDKRTYNVAPPVVPSQEFITAMRFGSFSWGGYTIWRQNTSTGRRRVYAPWNRTGPDAFGNYKYELNNVFMPRKVIGNRVTTATTGVAGKLYSATVDISTYVTAMPGAFDYVAQPNARINLYATNGTEAQDVLIAQSNVINSYNTANDSYPFHPGKRDNQVQLLPVAAMPVGKLFFRLEVEHDNDWTANKTIWLPDWYYGSADPWPPQLAFWEIDFDAANLFEEASGIQEWVSTGSHTTKYDWRTETIETPGFTDGIQATIDIPTDSLIDANGGVFSAYIDAAYSSFGVTISGGTAATATVTVPASATAGWFTVPLALNQVNNDTVTIKVNRSKIAKPALYANISPTGTDGHNYFTYVDRSGSCSAIETHRYDSEVSTCSLTLRDDTGIDVDETFAPGKAIRLIPNVTTTVESRWGGVPMNYAHTVFQGTIENRGAKYPRGARPEIKVLATNSFPVLQEKTEYAFKALENYTMLFPYLGIVTIINETGVISPAKPIDPNASAAGYGDYEGLWRLRDGSLNMTMLDALFITRNSQFGYAYFDRFNRIILASTQPIATTVFTDQQPDTGEFSYSKLDLHYGTNNIINYVNVTAFDHVVSEAEDGALDDNLIKTELAFYDADSVRKYRKAEYKIQMFNRLNWEDIEAKILDKYTTPQVTANTMRFPVRTQAELAQVALIDMYQNITVKYEGKLDETFRITSIHHYIKPGETWITECGFGLNTDGILW